VKFSDYMSWNGDQKLNSITSFAKCFSMKVVSCKTLKLLIDWWIVLRLFILMLNLGVMKTENSCFFENSKKFKVLQDTAFIKNYFLILFEIRFGLIFYLLFRTFYLKTYGKMKTRQLLGLFNQIFTQNFRNFKLKLRGWSSKHL
jgi:hypothetical protein